MKFFKCFLVAVFAFVLFVDANVSTAQETTESKPASTQTKKKNGKKKAKKDKRGVFLEALKESVEDLTDDQKKTIESLREEAGKSHKEINESVGLTWKLSKKRQEIFDGLSADLSYKERSEKASSEAGFSEDQVKALKDIANAYRQFRFKAMKALTAEQQSKMPQWYQDDFKQTTRQVEKEAAKKKKIKSSEK